MVTKFFPFFNQDVVENWDETLIFLSNMVGSVLLTKFSYFPFNAQDLIVNSPL